MSVLMVVAKGTHIVDAIRAGLSKSKAISDVVEFDFNGSMVAVNFEAGDTVCGCYTRWDTCEKAAYQQ